MTRKKLLPPKRLVPTEKTNAFNEEHPVEIEVLVYDENSAKCQPARSMTALKKNVDAQKINLILISDLTEPLVIDEISKFFKIDPLVMEDALSESDIPTVQELGDQLLFTLKLMNFKANGELVNQHIGLLLGEYYVIVFKDAATTIFDEVKKRIENGNSKARLKNSDYLFYLMIDSVIDTYYEVVNEIDNKIDKMEAILLERPQSNYIGNLYRIKQPMSEMRGIIYPIREALTNMVQGDYHLIEDETIPYFHDVQDHVNNIVHMYDMSRETMSDLLEINNSNINNRLNGTVKILTIITTLFIPLTLISGIYGMNFRFMPELTWKWGYPMILGVMLITAGLMYLYMKRKKLL